MKKNISIIAVFIFIILVSVYTFPQKISHSLEGINFRLGEESLREKIVIKIEGKLKRRPFTGKIFVGDLNIGDRSFHNIKLKFDENNSEFLDYFDEKNQGYTSFGRIYINDDMSQVAVSILELDCNHVGGSEWNSDGGLMVSAPAANRVDAVAVANNVLGKKLKAMGVEEPLK